MKDKFFISDHNYSCFQDELTLGLFHLGRQQYEFNLLKGVRSYSFCVVIMNVYDAQLNNLFSLKKKSFPIEFIEGEYIGDVSSPEYQIYIKESGITTHKFNWYKFLELNFPELLKNAQDRLARKVVGIIPEKVIYKATGESKFCDGYEFLEFDDTADRWAGPFKLEGKKGCVAKISVQENPDKYPILDVSTKFPEIIFQFSDDPVLQNLNKEKLKNKSESELRDIFNSFDLKTKNKLAKTYYQNFIQYTIPSNILDLPYEIFLRGNDDCSYSKWFETEEEREKEMNYLRMMQPLNFVKDIQQRDYIFTN